MDKNSINTSPEIVSRAPSTRHIERDDSVSTMEYFRGKSGKKSIHKIDNNGKTEHKKENTAKPKKKTRNYSFIAEYLGFVHTNNSAPIIKQALFNAGITSDLFIHDDCYDAYESENKYSKYDPRINDDIREM